MNLRPPAPKAGALAKLRYAPLSIYLKLLRNTIVRYISLNTSKNNIIFKYLNYLELVYILKKYLTIWNNIVYNSVF